MTEQFEKLLDAIADDYQEALEGLARGAVDPSGSDSKPTAEQSH